jgi:hypothetical protein
MPDPDQPPDLTADPQALRVVIPNTVIVRFAETDGTCETPDGPIPYRAGDALIGFGPIPLRPMPRDAFFAAHTLHYPSPTGQGGTYTQIRPVFLARQLDRSLTVPGENARPLTARPGDWLLLHPDGHFRVIADMLFRQVYGAAPGELRWPPPLRP